MNENNNKLTIVNGNDLIEAGYSLTLDEMRVINLALTKIDSRKPNVGVIKIGSHELTEMYGLSSHNAHRNLKNALKELNSKPIKIPYVDDKGKARVRELSWLMMLDYAVADDGSEISIEFTPRIEPYLFELKNRFTSVDMEQVSKLNTPFSYRLYQWLIKAKNLKNSANGVTVVRFDLAWIKERTGLVDKYPRYGDFKDYVIKPAVEQINSKTDISIMFTPIKTGRSVKEIEFTYIIENAEYAKPQRPRLLRRPKVVIGSHEEGSWMRHNMKLLLKYEEQLIAYDPRETLSIKDLERLKTYSSICSTELNNRVTVALNSRKQKKVT
jgi:plasmid replication initiation protein